MEFPCVRSPSFSTGAPYRQRPGGPRSPKSPTKGMIPLDLSARVEEATPAYSSPRSSTWPPSSPELASESDLQSEYGGSGISRRNTTSRAIQTGTPVPVPSIPSTPLGAAPTVKVIKKTPALTPPPAVNFDAPSIPWRGMPYEAAQWSLTSEQLQEIVSTAIRTSAQENFIRLVSQQTFDVELKQELERLNLRKATTQAQYRFHTQRRLMLLQSLNALSFAPGDPSSQEALSNLTAQLAALAAACDRLMETLLTIADQRAQIQRLQDAHVASALAISLRKLNGSYGRRVAELKEARGRVGELQAELEEAWGVAEELAQEMDDLDNFGRDFGYEGEDVFEDEASAVSREGSVVVADSRTELSVQMAEVVGVTATAVSTQATYATLFPGPIAPSPAQLQVADRTNRVKSARRRSVRTSKGRLRLTSMSEGEPSPSVAAAAQTARRARSRSRSRRRPTVSTEDAPAPVPAVPTIHVEPAPAKGSFLEFSDTRPTTPSSAVREASPRLPPPPVPPVRVINTNHQKRDILEVRTPQNCTPSTPGFDRTIIPPFTFRAARMSKDDSYLPSEQEREGSNARRVQSLTVRGRGRGETVSLYENEPGPSRTPHRLSDGEVLERGRAQAQAKRYLVPLKAAQVQDPSPSPRRPSTTGDIGYSYHATEMQQSQPLRGGGQEEASVGRSQGHHHHSALPSPAQEPAQEDLPPPLPPKDESVTPTARPPEAA